MAQAWKRYEGNRFQGKTPKKPGRNWYPFCYKIGVKSEVEVQKPASDFESRSAVLDAKMAILDARIARNKADLERTNSELTLKIAEMVKRLGSK